MAMTPRERYRIRMRRGLLVVGIAALLGIAAIPLGRPVLALIGLVLFVVQCGLWIGWWRSRPRERA